MWRFSGGIRLAGKPDLTDMMAFPGPALSHHRRVIVRTHPAFRHGFEQVYPHDPGNGTCQPEMFVQITQICLLRLHLSTGPSGGFGRCPEAPGTGHDWNTTSGCRCLCQACPASFDRFRRKDICDRPLRCWPIEAAKAPPPPPRQPNRSGPPLPYVKPGAHAPLSCQVGASAVPPFDTMLGAANDR